MEIQIWWLLGFPLFFAFGWMASRVDLKQLLSESRQLPSSYFKGLNFLLNEEQDKALEAFNEIAKVDPQTTELHFALGNLFRKRGEIDRATRIHKNILDRTDLKKDERLLAIFELGQDYFKAGVLNLAEEFLIKLKGTSLEKKSYNSLLLIYEQEKDWLKAIDCIQYCYPKKSKIIKIKISNYFCELALEYIRKDKISEANEILEKAHLAHSQSARPKILLGEIAFLKKNFDEALSHWNEVEIKNPTYFFLIAKPFFSIFKKNKRKEDGLKKLYEFFKQHPCYELFEIIINAELENNGKNGVRKFLKLALELFPNIQTLNKYLEFELSKKTNDLPKIVKIIKSINSNHTNYLCKSCGFKAKVFYWHCPACNQWETYLESKI